MNMRKICPKRISANPLLSAARRGDLDGMCDAVRNDTLRSGATMVAVGGGAMAGGLVLKAVAPCVQALGVATLVVSGLALANGNERQKRLAEKGAIAGALMTVAGGVGALIGSALVIGGAVVATGGAVTTGVGLNQRARRFTTVRVSRT